MVSSALEFQNCKIYTIRAMSHNILRIEMHDKSDEYWIIIDENETQNEYL